VRPILLGVDHSQITRPPAKAIKPKQKRHLLSGMCEDGEISKLAAVLI
jgi:hypothetical protein